MARAVGIDLGTTYSLVAAVGGGRADVLREAGEGRVPSAVFFARDLEQGAHVGGEALEAAHASEGVLLTSTKRFMGRGAQDALAFLAASGARSFALADGDARVVRFALGGGKSTTPVEVAAYVLKALRDRAEAQLGEPITQAVITVPAYFDDAQRQATREAGRLAGLRVLRLLAEPTAAAIAYGLDKEAEGRGQGTYVVFDLGGGTFDVSVLQFDRGLFRVRATAGDTALGGDDFDHRIAAHVLTRAGFDVASEPPRIVQRALAIARAAKEALSDADEVRARGALDDERTVDVPLSRLELDALVAPVVARCEEPSRRALADAGVSLDDIDGVVLVGGSTRMPLVRSKVREWFGREPLLDAHPDEVVAVGAALQADLLTGGERDLLLLDVTPLSLGLETMGGVVDKLIPRNRTIPCSATHSFTTYADGQTAMDIHVVQGEREHVDHNRSLARVRLRGIPPMPAGMARVAVTFTLDADGVLVVTAHEELSGTTRSLEVKPSFGLNDAEIERMLLESIDHAERDVNERLLIERRVEARRVLEATRKALAEDGALLVAAERTAIDEAVVELERALTSSDRAAIEAANEALDRATLELAKRRMEKGITEALAHKRVDEVRLR